MIRKLSLFLFSLAFFAACSKPSDLEKVYNPMIGFKTGTWQMAFIVEMDTNFSSLIFDKTEASFETFSVHAFTLLPDDSAFYIVPVIKTDMHNQKHFDDDSMSFVMANYIRINNYGRVVKNLDEADYVVVIDVKESMEKLHGTNYSIIAISIQDLDETPVFYAYSKVTSKSDKNFYYRLSKQARPVKYLTLKGFERMFLEALPQAFS